MLDLATAVMISNVVGGAVSSIDKIYRAYAEFSKNKNPIVNAPPPSFQFQNKPDQKAFVATDVSTGTIRQKVTYDELSKKLNPGDRAHIEALGQAMSNYEKQWDAAVVAKSMASGMDVGRYDAQLDHLAREISKPLAQVLDFVEHMGLGLDDHYLVARDIARNYTKSASR